MSDLFDVPVQEQQEDDANEWLIALVVVLLLLRANANRPLTPRQRQRARDLLRSKFEQDVTRHAVRVSNDDLGVDAWQVAMIGTIADYTRQMAVAGAGFMPSRTVQQVAWAEIRRQAPYLAGFAAAIVQGGLSQGGVAARSKLYGKSGWGVYYIAQGSTAGDGIVERWETRDDQWVCRNCAPRHGRFFLPGVGPMPGLDCLGSCRCERVQVYDPDMWRRLNGRRAA